MRSSGAGDLTATCLTGRSSRPNQSTLVGRARPRVTQSVSRRQLPAARPALDQMERGRGSVTERESARGAGRAIGRQGI